MPPTQDQAIASQDLLRILDVTRRMAEQRALNPLLAYIANEASHLVGAERCYVVLFDDAGELDFRETRDPHGHVIPRPNDQVSHAVLDKVRAHAEPLLLHDAMGDAQFDLSRSVHSLQLRSILCAPLVSHDCAIGAIYVENRSIRGMFNEGQLALLALFANQASVALSNATLNDNLEERIAARTQDLQQRNAELEQLRDQLRELSIRDGLTQLYNRRHLDQLSAQLFAQAKQAHQPFSIAIADIDGFKQINDCFSHSLGDAVLSRVAQLIQHHAQPAAVAARYGGEEFVLLMPNTSLKAAAEQCERIRGAIEREDWQRLHSQLRVTLSMGLASNEGCTCYDAQFREADAYLLQAKQTGKNLVVNGSGGFSRLLAPLKRY
jgi:diguanylate cyclase (GGDEF)-like protein